MTISVTREDAVAVITLGRPDVLNAFNDEMGMTLLTAVSEAAGDPDVRCIVITGEGRAFCSGEDLSPLRAGYEQGEAHPLGDTLVRRYNPLIRAITSAPKPVVAAVNGVAAGAGASLALACDFRLASEKAKLVLAFIKVGLVPDSGALWFLAQMVGTSRAWKLAATAEPLSADVARDLGIFHEVSSVDEFEGDWRSFAAELASGPTRAFALTKALLYDATERSLAAQLELEVEAQSAAGASADHLEGVRAFFDRRQPTFEGR